MAIDIKKAKSAFSRLSQEQQQTFLAREDVQPFRGDLKGPQTMPPVSPPAAGGTSSTFTPTDVASTSHTATPETKATETQTFNYGDTGGASTSTQYSGEGAQFSSGKTQTTAIDQTELKDFSKFGEAAIQAQEQQSGFLSGRNDIITSNLFSQGKTDYNSIKSYLEGQAGFSEATPGEQENTITAIQNRLGQMGAGGEDVAGIEGGAEGDGEISELDQLTERFQTDINKLTDKFVANKAKMEQDLWKRKSQATNWEQIMGESGDVKRFNDAILELKGEGQQFTIDDVARKLGWTKEKADDYRVGTTRDANQLTKYLDVPGVEEEVTDERQKVLDQYETDNDRNMEDLEIQMTRMTDDFNKKIERTQKEVDIEVANNKFMSALTGLSFSTNGLEGIQHVEELAKNTMDDIYTNKDRTLADITRTKIRLIEDYDTLTTEAKERMQTAINTAKSNFLTKVQAAQDQFGDYSEETLDQIEQVTRTFSKEYRNINRETQKSVMEEMKYMQGMQNDLNEQDRLQREYNQDWLKNMGQGTINLSTSSPEFQALDGNSKISAINNMVSIVANALEADQTGSGSINMDAIKKGIANGQTPDQVFRGLGGNNIANLTQAALGDYDFEETGGPSYNTGPEVAGLQFGNDIKSVPRMNEQQQRQNLVDYGYQNVGLNYEFGADGSKAVDCSQLLVSRGTESGILPEGTDMTAATIFNKGTEKGLNELTNGDFIYYDDGSGISHVGIALGPKQADGSMKILDASVNAGGVAERTINISEDGKLMNDKKYTIKGTNNWMAPGKIKEGEAPTQAPYIGFGSTAPVKLDGLARSTWEGKSNLSTVTKTEAAKVYKEMVNAGYEESPLSGGLQFAMAKITDYNAMIQGLNTYDNIQILDELIAGDGSITGPIQSKYQNVLLSMGIDKPVPDNYIELRALVGMNLANYIKEISGAAVSEEEAVRLAKNVPTENDNDAELMIKLHNFSRMFNNGIQARSQFYGFEKPALRRERIGFSDLESATSKRANPTTYVGKTADELWKEMQNN